MGGYRDDRESLHAHIRELEGEVEVLRARVETAEGSLPASKEIVLESEIDGVLDDEALGEVVALMRKELGAVGNAQQVGRTFAWSLAPGAPSERTRRVSVSLESRAGLTNIRLVERLEQLHRDRRTGGIALGALSGVFMAILLGIVFRPLAVLGVAFMAASIMLHRRSYRRLARARQAQLTALMGQIEGIALEMGHAVSPEVRVGAPDEAEADPEEAAIRMPKRQTKE